MSIYVDLLQKWCDGLVRLQVRTTPAPGDAPGIALGNAPGGTSGGAAGLGLSGGILCPACARIHGRCADAVYPLLCLAKITGRAEYVRAAIDLQAWSDHVSLPDGSWTNDPIVNDWRGITVFGAIALGEALRHHGALLDPRTKNRWLERFRRAVDFLYGFMNLTITNINYPATCAAALALAGDLCSEPRYTARGRELARAVLKYCGGPSFLVAGEGRPIDGTTTKGCRPVDLAYNVEETLPHLALYGSLTGDDEVLAVATRSLQSHLEFMLPDGAWDDSWATRQFKWTYWGSRTSDGCQLAFALLATRDPRFAVAARRNAELLARCTANDILYGGLHYALHGEKPCIHHGFCHAKAMAAAIDHGLEDVGPAPTPAPAPRSTGILPVLPAPGPAPGGPDPRRGFTPGVPRELISGVKHFPEIATHLISIGPWRATVTDYDWVYHRGGHPTGGALSLLWHADVGPIIAAGMTDPAALPEPLNMQYDYRGDGACATPRIELRRGSERYLSICDLTAKVQVMHGAGGAGAATGDKRDGVMIRATGQLADLDGKAGASGAGIGYEVEYGFEDKAVWIEARVEPAAASEDVVFILPLICDDLDSVQLSPARAIVPTGGGSVIVEVEPDVAPQGSVTLRKAFNFTPGFQIALLTYPLSEMPGGQRGVKLTCRAGKP